jgi:hypothetical protein
VIHIKKAAPPADFVEQVATPGQYALWELLGDPRAPVRSGRKRAVVATSIGQIPSNSLPSYWTRAIPDLCVAYKRICAYLGLRIHPGVAAAEVDHFKPKTRYQHLAYDWDNFRLSCKLANTFKYIYEDVVDPFEIVGDCFGVNLFSGRVIAISRDASLRPAIEQTIIRLHLNTEPTFVDARLEYINDYLSAEISFDRLLRDAPFVAREIERQGKKR